MGIGPVVGALTVATAGSKVQATTSASIYVTSVYFEALGTNNGAMYIGDVNVASSKYMAAISPGQGFTLKIDAVPIRPSDSNGGPEINLNTIYLDSAINGNICMMTYIQRVGSK